MHSKTPSIIFPGKQSMISVSLQFSKSEIRSLCNLQPFTVLAHSMGNYAIQRNKTHQMKKQYAAMAAAVDAEYTALENQAYIHFQELTKQLSIEFEAKSKFLEIEIQKAEIEADKQFHENEVAFEVYIKTSTLYKKIFDVLTESAYKISQLIQFAEKEDIATNTNHYIKLSEQYRTLLRGIEKYSKLLA